MFIKSICLSGGGVYGFVHIGVLQKLVDDHLLKNVDTIVGTSVGTVIGTLFALGLKPNEINNAFMEIEENAILKYSDLNNFFNVYGMDSGEYFMAYIVDIFTSNGLNPMITFAEVSTKFKKRLIFTGTNVTHHKTDYFSPDTTPNMRILDAIRISISVPFLFSAVRYGDNVYVDGGIIDNYPLKYCTEDFLKRYPFGDPLQQIVGCNIKCYLPRKILYIEDFLYNLLACWIKKNVIQNAENTISINMGNIKSIEFNISKFVRKQMFQQGYNEAENWIKETKKNAHKRLSISRRNSI